MAESEVDKASGIVNDANDWSDGPRYIIELLKRIVTVSLETTKTVDGLPPLEILEYLERIRGCGWDGRLRIIPLL
ncbi:hypothetical protein ACWCOW_40505 [Streptomyces sp. NPDC001939]